MDEMIELRIGPAEAALLDRKRGNMPRETWLRMAIESWEGPHRPRGHHATGITAYAPLVRERSHEVVHLPDYPLPLG